MEYEQAFMFYLPRICEHCLNPSCVASCPSGAMYKREEDGIVLVDQDKCRGLALLRQRLPLQEGVLQPPLRQGREVHALLPAHRGRPADDLLGDLRRPHPLPRPAALRRRPRRRRPRRSRDEHDLLDAQRGLFLDPADPDVRRAALADGISPDWIEHAQRSPVHALVARYKVALPLHPEYRTMPMVWYVPPLSPIVNALEEDGYEADPDDLFPAVETACGSRSSTSPTCSRPATPT